MAMNVKCPKCGSTHVQLSDVRSRHGCLMTLLFGIFYFIAAMIRWSIGILIIMMWDWWMAIIKACMKKGYVWKGKRWLSGHKKVYYCHDCGYNFKG